MLYLALEGQIRVKQVGDGNRRLVGDFFLVFAFLDLGIKKLPEGSF